MRWLPFFCKAISRGVYEGILYAFITQTKPLIPHQLPIFIRTFLTAASD